MNGGFSNPSGEAYVVSYDNPKFHKLAEIKRPDHVALVGDGHWYYSNPNWLCEWGIYSTSGGIPTCKHSEKANICFVDGHVEPVGYDILKLTGAQPGNIWNLHQ